VQRRRPTDMPGGLMVSLLWKFASSSRFPWSEKTFMFCGVSRRADMREILYFLPVGSGAHGNIDSVN